MSASRWGPSFDSFQAKRTKFMKEEEQISRKRKSEAKIKRKKGSNAESQSDMSDVPVAFHQHRRRTVSDKKTFLAGILAEKGEDIDSYEVRERSGSGGLNYTLPLISAAGKGDVEDIKTLIDNGADISQSDFKSRNSVWHATNAGKVEAVAYLLGCGAEEDMADVFGQTPLMVALSIEKTKDKTELDEDSEEANEKKPTSSTVVVTDIPVPDRIALINLLVEAGAHLSKRRGSDGLTAIHIATISQSSELLAALLKKCQPSQIDCTDISNRTALELAVEMGYTEQAGILLEYGAQKNVNPLLEKWQEFLRLASSQGSVACVYGLLSLNVDSNSKDKESGLTSLHAAISTSQLLVVECLMENGADPHITDNMSKMNGLHKAASRGHKKIVQYILNSVEDDDDLFSLLYLRDRNGRVPLHYACMSDDTGESARLLLEADKNYSSRSGPNTAPTALIADFQGRTPLHMSVNNDNPKKIIDVLISFGAEMAKKDKQDKTALDLAREWNNHNATIHLLSRPNGTKEHTKEKIETKRPSDVLEKYMKEKSMRKERIPPLIKIETVPEVVIEENNEEICEDQPKHESDSDSNGYRHRSGSEIKRILEPISDNFYKPEEKSSRGSYAERRLMRRQKTVPNLRSAGLFESKPVEPVTTNQQGWMGIFPSGTGTGIINTNTTSSYKATPLVPFPKNKPMKNRVIIESSSSSVGTVEQEIATSARMSEKTDTIDNEGGKIAFLTKQLEDQKKRTDALLSRLEEEQRKNKELTEEIERFSQKARESDVKCCGIL